MTYLRSIIIALLLLPFASFGQQDPPKQRRVYLSDIQVQGGVMSNNYDIPSLDFFRQGLPNSVILSEDLSHLDGGLLFTGVSSPFTASLRLGLDLRGKSKDLPGRPQLRVGLTTHRHRDYDLSLQIENSYRQDTLVSPTSGTTIYQDSIVTEGLEAIYESNALMLDASLVFRTNPDRRCSAFVGAGFAAGMSTFARSYIDHYAYYSFGFTHSGLGSLDSPWRNTYGGSLFLESEYIEKLPAEWALSAYIPMGVDLRLGRQDRPLGRWHLYTEIRTLMTFRMASRFGNINTFAQSAALGLRVELR